MAVDKKALGSLASISLATLFGIIGVATYAWTTVTFLGVTTSQGIFGVQAGGETASFDLADCDPALANCDALKATAAFAIIGILLNVFAFVVAAAKSQGKEPGGKALAIAVPLLAMGAYLLALIVYAGAYFSDVASAFDLLAEIDASLDISVSLGYSWGMMIVASAFDVVAAILLK